MREYEVWVWDEAAQRYVPDPFDGIEPEEGAEGEPGALPEGLDGLGGPAAGEGASPGGSGSGSGGKAQSAEHAAASSAAGVVALCAQLNEPAFLLVQCGCLAPPTAEQLAATREQLEGVLPMLEQVSRRLPAHHPLLAAVQAAMEAAPQLWQPAEEESEDKDEGEASSGSEASGSGASDSEAAPSGQRQRRQGGAGAASGAQPAGKARGGKQRDGEAQRRRRVRDVRNPAVRAMLAEEAGAGDMDAGDLSDLEDFIVCNPGE